VIAAPQAAVIQAQLELLTEAARGNVGDAPTKCDLHLLEPRHEPGGAGRTEGADAKSILQWAGQAAIPIWSGDEPADTGRTHFGRREQKPRQRSEPVQDAVRTAQEVDTRSANEQFDLRSHLVQQCRRLERALTPADDDHALAGEATEVAMLGGVGNKFRRKLQELLRLPGKGHDSAGHHELARAQQLAIFKLESEAPVRLDACNLAPIELRERLLLEPAPVVNELLQADGAREGFRSGALEVVES